MLTAGYATSRFELTTGLAVLPSVEAMLVLGLLGESPLTSILDEDRSRGFESRQRLAVQVWDAFLVASVGLSVVTLALQG